MEMDEGENVVKRMPNRAGANVMICAVSDMIPAMTKSSFLDIWCMRIAQKGLFFYACNILCQIYAGRLYSFESIVALMYRYRSSNKKHMLVSQMP